MKDLIIPLKIDAGQSVRTMAEIEERVERLTDDLKGVEVGSTAFKQLSKELGAAKGELKSLEIGIDRLDPIGRAEGFVKMGEGIAGGFAIATGAMTAFGAESEELAELEAKAQGAVAVAVGLRAIQESQLIEQLRNSRIVTLANVAAQKLYTFVMNGATVATKAFRAALLATGIGAVVVLITALVTAIQEMNEELEFAEELQNGLNEAQITAEKSVRKEAIAVQSLVGIIQDQNAANDQKLAAYENLQEKVGTLAGLTLEEAIASGELNEQTDRYITLAKQKALVDTLSTKIADLQIEQLEKEQQGVKENVAWYESAFVALKNMGDVKKTILELAEREEQVNAEANKQAEDRINFYQDELESVFASMIATEAEVEAEISAADKIEEARKKRMERMKAESEARKTAADENAKIQAEFYEAIRVQDFEDHQIKIDNIEQMAARFRAAGVDQVEIERWKNNQIKAINEEVHQERVAVLNEQAETLRQLQQENYLASIADEQARALEQLELERQDRLTELADHENFQALKLEIDAKFERDKAAIQEGFRVAAQTADEQSAKARMAVGQSLIQNLIGAADEGSAAWQGLKIAETLMSTYQGAQAAYVQAMGAFPPPYGQIAGAISAAAVVASGVKAVTKIKSTKLPGGSSGTGASVGASGIGTGDTNSGGNPFQGVDLSFLGQGDVENIGGSQVPQTLRAYTVSSELSDQQAADQKTEELSSL